MVGEIAREIDPQGRPRPKVLQTNQRSFGKSSQCPEADQNQECVEAVASRAARGHDRCRQGRRHAWQLSAQEAQALPHGNATLHRKALMAFYSASRATPWST
jgi:hypothetical protein